MNFEDLKNYHAGETIIVCGLGESINLVDIPIFVTTIGCNDIGRKFHPDYLVSVNNRSQYKDDRWNYIEKTQANYVLTHIAKEHLGITAPLVTFKIQTNPGGVEVLDGYVPHYRTSPYLGCALAHYMGAHRIGLLGVDFTDNHFYIKDGPHRMTRELANIDAQFGEMRKCYEKQKVELVNLSPISLLTSLPKRNLDGWLLNH